MSSKHRPAADFLNQPMRGIAEHEANRGRRFLLGLLIESVIAIVLVIVGVALFAWWIKDRPHSQDVDTLRRVDVQTPIGGPGGVDGVLARLAPPSVQTREVPLGDDAWLRFESTFTGRYATLHYVDRSSGDHRRTSLRVDGVIDACELLSLEPRRLALRAESAAGSTNFDLQIDVPSHSTELIVVTGFDRHFRPRKQRLDSEGDGRAFTSLLEQEYDTRLMLDGVEAVRGLPPPHSEGVQVQHVTELVYARPDDANEPTSNWRVLHRLMLTGTCPVDGQAIVSLEVGVFANKGQPFTATFGSRGSDCRKPAREAQSPIPKPAILPNSAFSKTALSDTPLSSPSSSGWIYHLSYEIPRGDSNFDLSVEYETEAPVLSNVKSWYFTAEDFGRQAGLPDGYVAILAREGGIPLESVMSTSPNGPAPSVRALTSDDRATMAASFGLEPSRFEGIRMAVKENARTGFVRYRPTPLAPDLPAKRQ